MFVDEKRDHRKASVLREKWERFSMFLLGGAVLLLLLTFLGQPLLRNFAILKTALEIK